MTASRLGQKEFSRRRRQLLRMIGRGGAAVLPAAPARLRNRDVEYPYRQDSDFYYLTGFAEPDAVAVLIPGRGHAEYILFCRERDPARETWDGPRAGQEGAVAEYGADDAFPIDDIDDILPGLLESCERVYHTMGIHPEFDSRVIGWVNTLRSRGSGAQVPQEFVSLDHLLHDMRLFKSRSEQAAMRRSAKVGVAAHLRAMRSVRPGMMEYEVEAEFLHEFRRHGGEPSYQPIVGGGGNACVLHYIANDARLEDGDLLLIDAGCELDYYACDITRTMPVNGRFSEAQRAIYDIVLEAHQAAIAQVQPGNHWNDPHDAAVRVVTRGLKRLGLLEGTLAALIRDEACKRFFMHKTGHWLGMDVHDVGDYRVEEHARQLEPGMVMTIEPGIYIPHGMRGVPKRWQGIGVRIEDDVIVTRDGHEVLTDGVPVDPHEIEAVMAAGLAAGRSAGKAA